MDEPPAFRRVLVPLDGSAFAEQVLEPASAFGRTMGSEFVLVRVVEPMVRGGDRENALTAPPEPGLVRRLQLLHDEEKAKAGTYLDGMADRLRKQGFRVETQVVVSEQAAVALLDAVKNVQADVIALSTHGRRGLSRLFLGSVADKVLRGASIPVLIHRPGSD